MPRALSEDEVQAFREQLCDVATRRFAEGGYEGVTLRALASDLGCSPMTPYRYFENKEDIFSAVRLAAFRRFHDGILAVARDHADPLDRLRATGFEYLRFAQQEPHAYRIMFGLDQTGEPDDPVLQSELERGWRPLVDTIESAIEAGRLTGDPLDLAHFCWVMLHGAVTLHLAGKLRMGRSLEDLVDPLMDNFIRGAQAQGHGD